MESFLFNLDAFVAVWIIHEGMYLEISFANCAGNVVLISHNIGLGESMELCEAAVAVCYWLDTVNFRLTGLVQLSDGVEPIGDIVVMRSDVDEITAVMTAHNDVFDLGNLFSLSRRYTG
jgi:hypothetical protein